MKQLFITFLLTLLMSMVGAKAFAIDAEIDGISYYICYLGSDIVNYAEVTGTSCSGEITIPATITHSGYYDGNYVKDKSFRVRYIGNNAFRDHADIISVNIGENVESIRYMAFSGCSGLTSIYIPKSVTDINSYDGTMFVGCNNLASIIVESGNKKYDSRNNCNALIETSTNKLIAGCKNTIIPGSVETIGQKAFYGCSGLISAVIPQGVTSISAQAFEGCGDLTSVTISSSVTSIAEAFSNCKNLSSIVVDNGNTNYDSRDNCNAIIESSTNSLIVGCINTIIPNTVTSIDGRAFRGSGITELMIPKNVTSIPYGLTIGCDNLTSIVVEQGNTKYDSREKCNAILETASNTLIAGCKNTHIPNSVATIGRYAFNGCSGLTSVEIPNSVTNISDGAFQDCSGITSLNIPTSVTTIGHDAFAGCAGLTSVIIPKSVTTIGLHAFWCPNVTSVTVEWETPLSIYPTFSNSENATLFVPSGCKAAYEAADYWEEFKEIVELPNMAISFVDPTVKSLCIANWDTDGDGELSTDEAAAITSLRNVFKGNKQIKTFEEFKYFTGLDKINSDAFRGCSSLETITIPMNVVEIGDGSFMDCSSLTALFIPKNVTKIESHSFSNCSGLSSIIVDDENPVFDSRGNCNAIIETTTNKLIKGCRNTVVPSDIASIGFAAFFGCSDMESMSLPASVTSINRLAFKGCSALSSISLPNKAIDIEEGAFEGTAWYNNQPDGIVYAGKVVYKYKGEMPNQASVQIDDGTLAIAERAFASCSNLTSIVIPNSVEMIGTLAFMDCI